MIYNTIGYNRWPRPWPALVPLWQRWPISAPQTAAWPFEWLIEQTSSSGGLPEWIPGTAYANFLNFFNGTMRWQITPSLVGANSASFISKAIGGTFEEPTGIFTDFEYVGGHSNDWESNQLFLEYEQPYDYDRNYQAETFEFRFFEKDLPDGRWAVYRAFTSRCGREWVVPDPL